MVLYNDHDPFCAAWLRELVAAGHLPAGEVDERSITDITPTELSGVQQFHAFAGIGGWPLALELAGYGALECWTGSCPCQPFSAAGKRQALSDERDVWPAFFRLITECHPPIVFGEQVEAAIGWGWLDRVFDDLEREDYAVGAAVLPACGVGAPHIRQRLYWVAIAAGARHARAGQHGKAGRRPSPLPARSEQRGASGGLAFPEPQLDGAEQPGQGWWPESANGGALGGVGHADTAGPQGHGHIGERTNQCAPWEASQVIHCLDGKLRRIPLEPALQPLAPGLSNRVGLLRGAGNSIVPQVAAEFIRAVQAVMGDFAGR